MAILRQQCFEIVIATRNQKSTRFSLDRKIGVGNVVHRQRIIFRSDTGLDAAALKGGQVESFLEFFFSSETKISRDAVLIRSTYRQRDVSRRAVVLNFQIRLVCERIR